MKRRTTSKRVVISGIRRKYWVKIFSELRFIKTQLVKRILRFMKKRNLNCLNLKGIRFVYFLS